MSVDNHIRSLLIDLPSQPAAVARLTALLGQEDCSLKELGATVESDMALAAAVLKAVNSSRFGLARRVQSIREAITYLGIREVAALTLQQGLQAVFPASPELNGLWQRAAARGTVMGRLAHEMHADAWVAHSAGLFEECGKAVLFRHSATPYQAMLAAAGDDDAALVRMEMNAFGVGHDMLGAALCETWGLAPAAVHLVRHRVEAHATLQLPPDGPERTLQALSLLAECMLRNPEELERVIHTLSTQLNWDAGYVAGAVRTVGMGLVPLTETA